MLKICHTYINLYISKFTQKKSMYNTHMHNTNVIKLIWQGWANQLSNNIGIVKI